MTDDVNQTTAHTPASSRSAGSAERTYGKERSIYYVLCEQGAAPTKRHYSRFGAMKEAQRLAEKNPGLSFHVVKLKDSFIKPDVRGITSADLVKMLDDPKIARAIDDGGKRVA